MLLECKDTTSYTVKMLYFQMIRGLVNPDIQEKVMSRAADKGGTLTLKEAVEPVTSMEMARRDQSTLTSSGGIHRQGAVTQQGAGAPLGGKKCYGCGSSSHLAKDPKCKAIEAVCKFCSKVGHFDSVCQQKKKGRKGAKVNEVKDAKEEEKSGDSGAVSRLSPISSSDGHFFFTTPSVLGMGVSHHTRDRTTGVWRKSRVKPHPKLRVRVEVDTEAYTDRGHPVPRGPCQAREIVALADTGAQMVVLSRSVARSLGVRDSELLNADIK